MLERLSRSRRNLALLGLGLLVLWFAWTIRGVLNPLILGYLLAYIMTPLVVALERRGHSQRAAVNSIFATGFLLATALLLGLFWQVRALTLDVVASARDSGPALAGEAERTRLPLDQSLQLRADEFTSTLRRWGLEVEAWKVPDLEGVRTTVRDFMDEHGEEAGRTGLSLVGKGTKLLARFVGGLVSALGLFFLVPLYTYYFLFVIAGLHSSIQRYFPRRERARLTRVFERIGEVISSFFRGRMAVALTKGLFLAVALTLFGMPYGFLLGMLSGMLSIIPFVGAFGGFVLALGVALLDLGVLAALWRAALVFGAGELVEGYVLVPKILGDRLGLHPLVVFFALLAGGAALGMMGFLIALPLTATLWILFQEFVTPALRQFADESGGDGPGGGGALEPG